MSRELITSWGDYQIAVDRLLALAGRRIHIYDEDLTQLKLDTTSRLTELQRLLRSADHDAVQIAVRNAGPLRTAHPKMLQLLGLENQRIAAQQTPPQLSHLRDSLLLVDDRHALIRFERDLPRSKLLIDEAEEIRGYLQRFDEIWAEGGDPVGPTTLGL